VCGRDGCGTEFCYHCKQLWHPNQTCDAARQQRAQNELLLTVYSPARAAVGQHHLAVVLMTSGDGRVLERMDVAKVHLLFNPWCKGNSHTHGRTHARTHTHALISLFMFIGCLMFYYYALEDLPSHCVCVCVCVCVLLDDAVYLPDEYLLQEYIMNENGIIFTGSKDRMSGMPWNFGQVNIHTHTHTHTLNKLFPWAITEGA